jgi:hypothetical protein
VRLLLFHVYFLENVGRPEGMSLEDIAQGYDAMYGMPSAKMKGWSSPSPPSASRRVTTLRSALRFC